MRSNGEGKPVKADIVPLDSITADPHFPEGLVMGTGTTFIYALMEPDGEVVRYIGKSDNPQGRFNYHMKDGRQGKKDHKSRWIAKLLQEGRKPVLTILEECRIDSWKGREQFWIEQYKATGKLTNHKNGGDGLEVDEAARKKMSLARMGKTPHNKGKQTPQSAREKQSEAAKRRFGNMTPEERRVYMGRANNANVSKSHPGWRHTDDAIRKISEASQRMAADTRLVDEKSLAEIRELLRQGIKQRDIAKQYGVGEHIISIIKTGKGYRS